jgi:hypothetical protein
MKPYGQVAFQPSLPADALRVVLYIRSAACLPRPAEALQYLSRAKSISIDTDTITISYTMHLLMHPAPRAALLPWLPLTKRGGGTCTRCNSHSKSNALLPPLPLYSKLGYISFMHVGRSIIPTRPPQGHRWGRGVPTVSADINGLGLKIGASSPWDRPCVSGVKRIARLDAHICPALDSTSQVASQPCRGRRCSR